MYFLLNLGNNKYLSRREYFKISQLKINDYALIRDHCVILKNEFREAFTNMGKFSWYNAKWKNTEHKISHILSLFNL